MAISNYFAPANAYGPQSGGFNPFPSDRTDSANRQQSSQALLENQLFNSPQVRALSGLVGLGLTGDPAAASNFLNKSAMGQFTKDIVAALVGSGLIPGGSPVNLGASVNQMIASSGFNIGGNMGRGSPLFGGGSITDAITKSVYENIQKTFFDKIGLPKSAAHGMNMSQMGEMISNLTGRGAFSGMQLGELSVVGGKYEFKQNADAIKKVNETIKDYAGMLKDAKSIFGNLSVAELTQNAERFVGTSIRELDGIRLMRNRMAQLSVFSSAFGLNTAAVANRIMQGTDSMQQQMFVNAMQDPRMREGYNAAGATTAFGRIAANISSATVQAGIAGDLSQTAASNLYAQQGVYMPVMGQQEITHAQSAGIDAILGGRDKSVSGNLLVGQYLLSTGKIKDPKVAKGVADLITQMGKTGDIRQTKTLNRMLGGILQGAGFNVDNIKATTTTAEMLRNLSPADTERLTEVAKGIEENRRIQEGLKDYSLKGVNFDANLFRSGAQGDANRVIFGEMFKAIDKEAQDALFSAVGPDGRIDSKKLEAAYKNLPGLEAIMPKDKFASYINQFAKDPGRARGNLGAQLSGIFDDLRRSPQFASSGASLREKRLAEERGVMKYIEQITSGGRLTEEDFSTSIMRGFFGSKQIGEDVILQSLRNSNNVAEFALGATGLNIGAKDIDRLKDTIGDKNLASLAKQLGVNPENKEALAAALSTPKGFMALKTNLGGAILGAGSKGNLAIATATAVNEETKKLETQAMMDMADTLLGKDVLKPSDLATEEGLSKFNKNIVSELTKDKGKRLNELSKKFKVSGYGGKEFAAMAEIYKSSPEMKTAILESAKQAQADGDKKRADELRAMQRELDKASGTGEAKFLGVLEVQTKDAAQLALYQLGEVTAFA